MKSRKRKTDQEKGSSDFKQEKYQKKSGTLQVNLPSKEQLPVDYSVGKFLLVYASVWSKLLQNIKCSECGDQEVSVEFSDAIGHSSKIILKCMSCS